MRKSITLFAVALSAVFAIDGAYAQLSPSVVEAAVLPINPTSADSLKLSVKPTCSRDLPYVANSYVVSMSQNNITVKLGVIVPRINVCPGPPVLPQEEFDLGRLPAGNYTISLIDSPNAGVQNRALIDFAPFTVTDARATKVAPYVRLDYSGHWWDPNDSGWGLFIWHDARDNVLAAWFTYTPDGKPIWYVFQPTFNTGSATATTPLRQTSRLPGTTSPPPGPTSSTVVGSASLDFTNFGTADEGKLTYTFTGGAQLVRNIQRFKP